MPDIKHHFRAGRMNKDLDERLVPNGEYRDAQNIEIVTSEGSNVGSIQNVPGTIFQDNKTFDENFNSTSKWGIAAGSSSISNLTNAECIGYVVDEQNNKIYWFIASGSTVTANLNITDPTAKVNGATTNSTSLVLDNNSGTIEVGDLVTGTGISGHVTVATVTDQNNIVLSSAQTLVDNTDLTFITPLTTITVNNASGTFVTDMVVSGGGIVGTAKVKTVSSQTSLVLSNKVFVTGGTLLTFKSTVSCIAEYDTIKKVVAPVLVDKNNILKFSSSYYITGANVLEGLLLFTDNQTEPKKIKISDFKAGSSTFDYHTQYNNADFTEKDITVIKLSPLNAPTLDLFFSERSLSSNGLQDGSVVNVFKSFKDLSYGDTVTLNFTPHANFVKDDIIKLTHEGVGVETNSSSTSSANTTLITYEVTLKIKLLTNSKLIDSQNIDRETFQADCIIQNISNNIEDDELAGVTWEAVLQEKKPIFEEKFVRFAYRWKYDDNQYSTFSPFSKIAFIPDTFEYNSLDAYNSGMSNNLRLLVIKNLDPKPTNVKSVEILLKESINNIVYVLDTIKNDDTYYNVLSENIRSVIESNQILRPFDNVPKRAKAQEISSNRLIYANYYQGYDMANSTIPNIETTVKQLSSNASVKQNFESLSDKTSNKFQTEILDSSTGLRVKVDPKIEVGMSVSGHNIKDNTFVKSIDKTNGRIEVAVRKKTNRTFFDSYNISGDSTNILDNKSELTFSKVTTPTESVKSQRTYQIGATFSDVYGRESPVFSSVNSSVKLDKSFCITKNSLTAQIKSHYPDWATHYKLFVKETSSEYYNLALDRFYFAEDGNVWLSFPSAERNKVDEENYLILKKKHDKNEAVTEDARYKILDISNEAPRFISTEIIAAGKASCIIKNNPPQVGNVFFKFSGPSPQENPAFANAFRSQNQIEISTNVSTSNFSDQKTTRRYTIKSGGSSNENVYTVELENPISPEDSNVLKNSTTQTQGTVSGAVSASTSVTLTEANSSITSGMTVTGSGIVGNVSVAAITGTSLTLSSEQTIADATTLTFLTSFVGFGKEVSITIFEKQIIDKDEFFGRFFVKINRDFIIDNCIINSFNAIKSSFEPITNQLISENVQNNFTKSSNADGEDEYRKEAAWTDRIHGKNSLLKTQTHPKVGDSEFVFYWSGISTTTGIDDGTENINTFISNVTKPGALIQFSNDFGLKGSIYQVTNSRFEPEFRLPGKYEKKSYGKRRKYIIGINKYTKGDEKLSYDDTFNPALASDDSSGNGIISKISIMKELVFVGESTLSSDNPAIFETEPKTLEGLDIYYETSNSLPIVKSGMKVSGTGIGSDNFVNSVEDGDNFNLLTNTNASIPAGTTLTLTDEKDLYSFTVTTHSSDIASGSRQITLADNQVFGQVNELEWFNCFSFGQGVESNRIKDDFNAPTIDKGAIVSTTLDSEFTEEHKQNSFIFSGIFNSTSGVNELNQFIQALPITKDINPIYGSIQKIFVRETDLITFCEDKVLKVLANKDALFNADGNTNLTASTNVLGQAIGYVGEYGISKNPESFSSHAFRIYFADKARGAVLRLSRDGLTAISEKGMSDFFGDNLALSSTILGTYNEDKGAYNITLNSQTLSFDERVDGWTSFKSFIPEAGLSINNIYYTFKGGNLFSHNNTVKNKFYDITDAQNDTTKDHQSSVNVLLNDLPTSVKSFKTLNYEGSDSRKYTYNGSIGATTIGAGTTLEVLEKTGYTPTQISGLTETETKGWYANSITTDQQTGSVRFFKEKENFKFNKILGDTTTSSNIDAKELSVQGLGIPASISTSGNDNFILTVRPNTTGSNFTISDDVTFSVLTSDSSGTVGSGKTAVFTVTPDTGYVISASQVSASEIPTGITSSVSISDTGTAGTAGNTVTVTFNMLSSHGINAASILQPRITVTELSLIQYTVTGIYNTDETNTATSSLYNFGYSASGDYFIHTATNGLVNNSTSVTIADDNSQLEPAIAVGMAVIASGVTSGTTVTAVSGTSLTLSAAATIPDDTILKFAKKIVTKTFTSDDQSVFDVEPTLHILNQDNDPISDYAFNTDWEVISALAHGKNTANTIFTITDDTNLAKISVGDIVVGDGITSFSKVTSIDSSFITIDQAHEVSKEIDSSSGSPLGTVTLEFYPPTVTANIYYSFSKNNPTEDRLLITARASKAVLSAFNAIVSFKITDKTIPSTGGKENIVVIGKPKAKFKLKKYTESTVSASGGSSSSENQITLSELNYAISSGMAISLDGTTIGYVKNLSSNGLVVTMTDNVAIANSSKLVFYYYYHSISSGGSGYVSMDTDSVQNRFYRSDNSEISIGDSGSIELLQVYGAAAASITHEYEIEAVLPTIISSDFVSSNKVDSSSTRISIDQLADSTVTLTVSESFTFTDATCDYNNGTSVSHDSNLKIKKGMLVTGNGIQAGSFVSSVTSATAFVLNQATTGGSLSNQTLTFTNVAIGGTTVFSQSGQAGSVTDGDNTVEKEFEVSIIANDSGSGGTPAATCVFMLKEDISEDMFKYATVEKKIVSLSGFADVADSGMTITLGFNSSVDINAIVANTDSTIASQVTLLIEGGGKSTQLPDGFFVKSIDSENTLTIAHDTKKVDEVNPLSIKSGNIRFTAPYNWDVDFENLRIESSTDNKTNTLKGSILINKFGTNNLNSTFDFFSALSVKRTTSVDDGLPQDTFGNVNVLNAINYSSSTFDTTVLTNPQENVVVETRITSLSANNIVVGKGTASDNDGKINTNSTTTFVRPDNDIVVGLEFKFKIFHGGYVGFWNVEATPSSDDFDNFTHVDTTTLKTNPFSYFPGNEFRNNVTITQNGHIGANGSSQQDKVIQRDYLVRNQGIRAVPNGSSQIMERDPTSGTNRVSGPEFCFLAQDGSTKPFTEFVLPFNATVNKPTITVGSCSYNNGTEITGSTSSLVVGMNVSGDNIPSGAHIVKIEDSDTFFINEATDGGNLSGKTLTFTSGLFLLFDTQAQQKIVRPTINWVLNVNKYGGGFRKHHFTGELVRDGDQNNPGRDCPF